MKSEQGSSLIEVVIAVGVLAVGALGAAAVFARGMQQTASSPGDLIATQKAAEAIESVFAARDSHKVTWEELKNVRGESGSDNGIFIDGELDLRTAGDDGVVNTEDDGDVETVQLPGRDQIFGNQDDVTASLRGFTRTIEIREMQSDLRSITVTVGYDAGEVRREYTLTTFISAYP
jgi:Tfp pilus assembly protein PilV